MAGDARPALFAACIFCSGGRACWQSHTSDLSAAARDALTKH
jgi:hypothetical protein